MTLEEATKNAAGYQALLEEAEETLRTTPRSSSLWRKTFLARSDARIMLEYYNGYVTKDSYGNEVHVHGLIHKLASEAQRVKEASNLGERFSDRTFGNFIANRDQKAFEVCRDYANNDNLFGMKKNSLIITGGVGTGKTHLAAAISNLLIDHNIPVLFGTFADHLENIRSEFDHTGQKKHLSMMKNTPMLVIDDLGKEKQTDWTQEILFGVVNYRYEHLLPIVVTTNLEFSELGNYVGSAVFSRLYEMSGVVTMSGSNFRMKGQ